jgi:BirA family transcriptional regulator, biotin operon repressor / biotin---[acetyl-CoA-carboxylase] ligase
MLVMKWLVFWQVVKNNELKVKVLLLLTAYNPCVTLNIPFRIETLDSLPSTQDEMRSRLERGENVHDLVIRALEQTFGRGQRARDWVSSKGGSYQTLAVRTENLSLNKPYAAIVIAIGLAQILPEYGIQVGIKWPNDLHYKSKKVAGILCEVVQQHLLIGVGMNVNNNVPERAIALRGLDVEGVSNFVLAGVQRGLELLQAETDLPTLFAPYDVLKDKNVSVLIEGKEERGVARGLHSTGCLFVEIGDKVQQICQGAARVKLLDSV